MIDPATLAMIASVLGSVGSTVLQNRNTNTTQNANMGAYNEWAGAKPELYGYMSKPGGLTSSRRLGYDQSPYEQQPSTMGPDILKMLSQLLGSGGMNMAAGRGFLGLGGQSPAVPVPPGGFYRPAYGR